MKTAPNFAALLQAYFTDRLMGQRNRQPPGYVPAAPGVCTEVSPESPERTGGRGLGCAVHWPFSGPRGK